MIYREATARFTSRHFEIALLAFFVLPRRQNKKSVELSGVDGNFTPDGRKDTQKEFLHHKFVSPLTEHRAEEEKKNFLAG